jgi:hypothetical protein
LFRCVLLENRSVSQIWSSTRLLILKYYVVTRTRLSFVQVFQRTVLFPRFGVALVF